MALFQSGQLVVYGNIGVCEVEQVEKMSFTGEAPREYYKLRPFFAQGNDRMYIPTEKEAVMRPLISREEAVEYLETMKDADVTIFSGKGQVALTEHYQELMQSHKLLDNLKLFKEICRKESMQKSKGRKLNAVDQHFYKLTDQLLSEEFALSLRESPCDASKRLHAAALS